MDREMGREREKERETMNEEEPEREEIATHKYSERLM